MKNLTRSERHELADLLEQARLWERGGNNVVIDEPDWAEVEAWTDRLREEAGPVEPTSYAARLIAQRYEGDSGTRVIQHAEWARESGSNGWSPLGESSTGALVWDELVSSYDAPHWTIEIYPNDSEA